MSDNPCEACDIGQYCCSALSGLRLSSDEYQRLFAAHAEELDVGQEGSLYEVSARQGRSCPNWARDHCAVYADRPMECRLFPYTMGRVVQRDGRVRIGYHSEVRCPLKETLLLPRADAEQMITDFAATAFGNDRLIWVRYETLPVRWKNQISPTRWKRKLKARLKRASVR